MSTTLRFAAATLAACALACARDTGVPETSACVQSRQQPRSFELARRCALQEAGLSPDAPEADARARDVARRFVAAGITPDDVPAEKWKALTRSLRKPAKRTAAPRPPKSAKPDPASLSDMDSSPLAARTAKIIDERLQTAPEAELFLAIAYGQIPHERAREPLIQRGLVREQHRDEVRAGTVAVGMSDLEVVLSQGPVSDLFTVKERGRVRRQLIYTKPDSLVITQDGFVTSWKTGAP